MTESKRPLKVFLCHASADKPAVRELYKRLTSDGVNAWLDVESLLPGQKWKEEIPKAIRNSDIVLVCMSEASINKEGFVQKEIKEALDIADEKPEGMIYIIPARLEECNVPASLAEYQWVDLYRQGGYDKLLLSFKARAKSIAATLLPGKLSQIEDVRSEAVQLELQGNLVESLKAYNQLKMLEPAYSGIDEKIQELQGRSKKRQLTSQIILALIGAVAIIVAGIFSFPLFGRILSPTSVVTENVIAIGASQPITASEPLETIQSSQTVSVTSTPMKIVTPTAMPLPTEITDAKGVLMVLVPAGEFTMGGYAKDALEECKKNYGANCYAGRFEDSEPPHKVYLDEFYVDKYEVTNALYESCVVAGVCSDPQRIVSDTRSSYYGDPLFGDYPVMHVDWHQASLYCEWRNAGLPTEAQWEKAARGTDGRTYPWGEGNDCNNTNLPCEKDTTKVGSYENGKSPYGVYDLVGNVWEWTADWYVGDYYSISVYSNPLGPETGDQRVVRGDPSSTAYSRGNLGPDNYFNIGFRCAKNAP